MRRLPLIILLLLAGCGGGPVTQPPPPSVLEAREMHRQALDAYQSGRYPAALAMFEEAEKLFRSIDDPHGIASAALSQAELYLLYGRHEDAARAAGRARNAIDRGSGTQLQPQLALVEARLRIPEDPTVARAALRELAALPGRTGALAALIECDLAMQAGDECLPRPIEGDPLLQARLYQLQGGASFRAGRNEEGLRRLQAALSIYRSEGYRPGLASVHEALAEARLQQGAEDEARQHLERALYLRLWINDAVHARRVLERLEPLASDAELAERYATWRASLHDDAAEPQWEQMMTELLTPL